MNPQIRRLWLIVTGLFLILALSTSYIQFLCTTNLLGADYNLNNHPQNTRRALRTKYIQRGPIMAGNTVLVTSTPNPNSKSFRKEYQRNYAPDGTDRTAEYAHLLGYLPKNGNPTGIEGLENEVLIGENGANSFSHWTDIITGKPPVGGGVKLTIDPAIQTAAWKAIGERRGAAVALNYQTGAILAAVSKPSYSLAEFSKKTPKEQEAFIKDSDHGDQRMLNRAFRGAYAPGSSFKIITTAAAMEKLKVTADTPVDAPRFLPFPRNKRAGIHNINNSECGNGNPPLKLAFELSCNTPFAGLAQQMGYQTLLDKAKEFGFNPKKPLRIPFFVTPSKFPDKDPGDYLLQEGIGQYNIQTNPLQMALVAGTIAAGGIEVKPYLVAAYTDINGKETRSFKGNQRLGTPVSEEIAKQIKSLMQGVVQNGTGKDGLVPGVEMGAKTGTAQRGNNYSNAWFVGYARPNNIPLAYAVIIEGDENQRNPHGGPVAGPVAKAMIEAALRSPDLNQTAKNQEGGKK